MTESPCHKEEEAFIKATKEWDSAFKEMSVFRVENPLDAKRIAQGLTSERIGKMKSTFDSEMAAHRRYEEAWKAWLDCLRRNLTSI